MGPPHFMHLRVADVLPGVCVLCAVEVGEANMAMSSRHMNPSVLSNPWALNTFWRDSDCQAVHARARAHTHTHTHTHTHISLSALQRHSGQGGGFRVTYPLTSGSEIPDPTVVLMRFSAPGNPPPPVYLFVQGEPSEIGCHDSHASGTPLSSSLTVFHSCPSPWGRGKLMIASS